jgi:hypothetical protein
MARVSHISEEMASIGKIRCSQHERDRLEAIPDVLGDAWLEIRSSVSDLSGHGRFSKKHALQVRAALSVGIKLTQGCFDLIHKLLEDGVPKASRHYLKRTLRCAFVRCQPHEAEPTDQFVLNMLANIASGPCKSLEGLLVGDVDPLSHLKVNDALERGLVKRMGQFYAMTGSGLETLLDEAAYTRGLSHLLSDQSVETKNLYFKGLKGNNNV